jgi:GAF domain-containing protein
MTRDPPEPADGFDARRSALLAQRFVALADTLVDEYDVVDLLDHLVDACVEVLDVGQAGLVVLDRHGEPGIVASSSEEVRLLELVEARTGAGPCVDCIGTGRPVVVEDLAEAAARWPQFTAAATELGFTGVHTLPMRLRDETIGGLTLFDTGERTPLRREEQTIAQALADVATIGILQQRSVQRAEVVAEQLQGALTTRLTIEQAKGVLAERGHISMDLAFTKLRAYCRQRRLTIAAVSVDVVARRRSLEEILTTPVV